MSTTANGHFEGSDDRQSVIVVEDPQRERRPADTDQRRQPDRGEEERERLRATREIFRGR
jgi:hypothetical protein